jgi:hypothetical protein
VTASSGSFSDSLTIRSRSSVSWPRLPREFLLMVVRREVRWVAEVDFSLDERAIRNDGRDDRVLF